MNALLCELCGSNDIVKQNGLYVCQHCGTKYTVDEARILLHSVKIDRSEEFAKYMKLAETCSDNNDMSNAYKYYSLALEIDPSNYKAYWGQIDAQCTGMFLKERNCSVFKDISLILQHSFGTLLDMIQSANDGAIDNVKYIEGIIKWYSHIAVNHAITVEDRVNAAHKEYRDIPYNLVLNKLAPYVECFNYMFEEMVDKTTEIYGENHVLVNTCRNEWIDFIERFKQFYIENDPNCVLSSNKEKMNTSIKPRSKKSLWSLFQ